MHQRGTHGKGWSVLQVSFPLREALIVCPFFFLLLTCVIFDHFQLCSGVCALACCVFVLWTDECRCGSGGWCNVRVRRTKQRRLLHERHLEVQPQSVSFHSAVLFFLVCPSSIIFAIQSNPIQCDFTASYVWTQLIPLNSGPSTRSYCIVLYCIDWIVLYCIVLFLFSCMHCFSFLMI